MVFFLDYLLVDTLSRYKRSRIIRFGQLCHLACIRIISGFLLYFYQPPTKNRTHIILSTWHPCIVSVMIIFIWFNRRWFNKKRIPGRSQSFFGWYSIQNRMTINSSALQLADQCLVCCPWDCDELIWWLTGPGNKKYYRINFGERSKIQLLINRIINVLLCCRELPPFKSPVNGN